MSECLEIFAQLLQEGFLHLCADDRYRLERRHCNKPAIRVYGRGGQHQHSATRMAEHQRPEEQEDGHRDELPT